MAISLTTLPIADMSVSQTLAALLPLRRDGHRQIASKDGGLVVEVYSGAIGVQAANALEARIVTAVNSHDVLLAALKKITTEYIRTRAMDDGVKIDGDFSPYEEIVCVINARAAMVLAGAA